MELRDLIGEHGENASRTATELQDAIGAGANGAVEIFVAFGAVVLGRVQIGRIPRAHRENLRLPSGRRQQRLRTQPSSRSVPAALH